jgi:hypothetical protein
MFKLLLDTNVWLDVAKDERQAPLLGVIEEMIREKLITLIVPRIVVDEFRRNRARIAKESAKSLSSHFRLVREAVNRIGGDKRRLTTVLAHLDNVNHKLPIVGGSAVQSLDRIAALLKDATIVETSDSAKLLAAQRAIDKRAPFHRDKNSMADALIVELYGEMVRAEVGTRFVFVTHNKSDFGDVNQKLPHPDIARFFSRVKSLYFINLAEALRRVEPTLVTDVMLEQSWTQEPRGLTEILAAEDLLFDQVWYNRHWNLRTKIEAGRHKLVDVYEPARNQSQTVRSVWALALKAAERVERERGKENLGPWDDFEWGMINGKLSALRWVLGDEWDMLDT